MLGDVVWYVRSCHLCQVQQTRKLVIPPVVATPALLFTKVFINTMHMPKSNSFQYIVQGRCSLSYDPEFRMLRKELSRALGDWIYKDILCRWGSLHEIVTDNGAPFLAVLAHINHIHISGYNSCTNSLIERSHFDVQQSLFKAVGGEESRWSLAAHSVFWAERVTPHKHMGCSLYFVATGSHPLIPLDISKATYLQPLPDSILSTTNLITRQAVALQKRLEDLARLHLTIYTARIRAAKKFEKKHAIMMKDDNFQKGNLVLVCNTAIKKNLNCKMRPRYLGPLIVVSHNFGGAYILCKLDGTILHHPITAFRVIRYFARKLINI
jgi:hypothetical protein